MTSEQPLLGWDPSLAELLREIDPVLLGRRLRDARVAAGLTQGDAGGEGLSTAYVSRIEAGARRPSARALQALAERVGAAPSDLLRAPDDDPAANELRLTLDYAELALETGEAAEAESQARAALEQLPAGSSLRERAEFLHGRALEATGRLDAAVGVLRRVAAGDGVFSLRATIALCRCLREAGELDRAVEEGEASLDRLREGHWAGSDETVQLVATVASCHFENGDVSRAARLCRDAVTAAEALGSPAARAAAYWNASRVESERGNVSAALPLAERALGLLGEGRDARNLARLRGAVRHPAAVRRAAYRAARRSTSCVGPRTSWSRRARAKSTSPVNSAAMARALMLDDDLNGAADRAREVLSGTVRPVLLASPRMPEQSSATSLLGGATWKARSRSSRTPLGCSAPWAQTARRHSCGTSWPLDSSSWEPSTRPWTPTGVQQRPAGSRRPLWSRRPPGRRLSESAQQHQCPSLATAVSAPRTAGAATAPKPRRALTTIRANLDITGSSHTSRAPVGARCWRKSKGLGNNWQVPDPH